MSQYFCNFFFNTITKIKHEEFIYCVCFRILLLFVAFFTLSTGITKCNHNHDKSSKLGDKDVFASSAGQLRGKLNR